jgi:hypothetical protein
MDAISISKFLMLATGTKQTLVVRIGRRWWIAAEYVSKLY